MPRLKAFPTDPVIENTVRSSREFDEAAQRLGLSESCVRKHARRLGVATRSMLGIEHLPQDGILKGLLREAAERGELPALARVLSVSPGRLTEECERLGIGSLS